MNIFGVISALAGAAIVQILLGVPFSYQIRFHICQEPSILGVSSSTYDIVTTMFMGNFISIVCARSLHYQFYSWDRSSVPVTLKNVPLLCGVSPRPRAADSRTPYPRNSDAEQEDCKTKKVVCGIACWTGQ